MLGRISGLGICGMLTLLSELGNTGDNRFGDGEMGKGWVQHWKMSLLCRRDFVCRAHLSS